MQDMIGKTIGEYQIVEQIGKGGMATVYRAFQPSLERDVAIKILPPYYAQQDSSFTERFKREARAIAKLRHPNILIVISYGEDEDITYIVMEYVEAGTLKERMEEPLSLKETYTYISQIANALDYAHGEGVVHRDIKPSNILLPKPDWTLLTDFGLAKMVESSVLTQSGMSVGTPAYMSPEQGGGEEVDARSDIYSLGVMLYEMVVGVLPYTAETPMAVVIKHIVDPLPMPRSKNPDVPEELQRIILKALSKNPDDRYQRAALLAEALEAVVSQDPLWVAESAPRLDPVSTKIVPEESSAQEDDPVAAATTAEKPRPKRQAITKKIRRWPIVAALGGVFGLVALIVVVGAVGLYLIYSWGWLDTWFGGDDQIRSTETTSQQTLLAAADPTLTSTSLPPTPTLTPTSPPPTETAVGVEAGVILFEDDFSNVNSGWDRAGDEDGFTDYVDDTYHIQIARANILWFTNPYRYFDDVRVEVDTVLYDGSEDNAFGIICAYEDIENFFIALISSNGYYGFLQSLDGDFEYIGYDGMITSSAINLGGAPNHMRVDCIDSTISLYVNGEFVDAIAGLDLTSGDVGLYGESFGDAFTEIEFDNFVVFEP